MSQDKKTPRQMTPLRVSNYGTSKRSNNMASRYWMRYSEPDVCVHIVWRINPTD